MFSRIRTYLQKFHLDGWILPKKIMKKKSSKNFQGKNVSTVNRTRGLKMTERLQSCALPTELLRLVSLSDKHNT